MRRASGLLVVLAACGSPAPEFVDATSQADAAADAEADAAADAAPDLDAAGDAATDAAVDAATDAAVDAVPVTIDHCGTISQNETWGPGIHRITCDVNVEGATGPILTIENGAEVRFTANRSLRVGVNAAGSLGVNGGFQPVTFTSDAASPAPGAWAYVWFGAYNGGSSIDNATFAYGGGSAVGGSWGTLVVFGGVVTVRDTTIRRSGTSAIAVPFTATLDLADSMLVDNTEYGLLMADARSNIVGPITNVVMSGNALAPVRAAAEHLGALHPSSTFTGNGDDRIDVVGNGGASGAVITRSSTWRRLSVPYHARATLNVGAASNPTITIDPGVRIVFDDNTRLISGAIGAGRIVARGTATDRIVLTSSRAIPAPGHWYGVYLWTSDRASAFEYVDILYGGGTEGGGPNATGAVDTYLQQGIATFDHVHVANSASNGIYSYWQNPPVLTNITYANNALANRVHVP